MNEDEILHEPRVDPQVKIFIIVKQGPEVFRWMGLLHRLGSEGVKNRAGSTNGIGISGGTGLRGRKSGSGVLHPQQLF